MAEQGTPGRRVAPQRAGAGLSDRLRSAATGIAGRDLSAPELTLLGGAAALVALVALVALLAVVGTALVGTSDADDESRARPPGVQAADPTAVSGPRPTTSPAVCPPDAAEIARLQEEAGTAQSAVRRTALQAQVRRLFDACGLPPPGTPAAVDAP